MPQQRALSSMQWPLDGSLTANSARPRVIDAILAIPDDVPTGELGPANAFRALIEICLGDYEEGRNISDRELHKRVRFPPSSMHKYSSYRALLLRWACAMPTTSLTICALRCVVAVGMVPIRRAIVCSGVQGRGRTPRSRGSPPGATPAALGDVSKR